MEAVWCEERANVVATGRRPEIVASMIWWL
jgi:hypothetical protein